MPTISALGRQRHEDEDFDASLQCILSFRLPSATLDSVFKNKEPFSNGSRKILCHVNQSLKEKSFDKFWVKLL